MAYNNYFPGNNFYQPQPQPAYSTNVGNNSNSIIWVQGEAGAKSYLVAPNSTVQLWDSEAQKIYLKSADASGMPNIRVLEYTFKDGSNSNALSGQNSEFASKSEVNALKEEINALKSKLEGVKNNG